jgi:hypothetical protein
MKTLLEKSHLIKIADKPNSTKTAKTLGEKKEG